MPITADGSVLAPIITDSLLNNVLDEVVAVLPTVIGVVVGFIAIRKGISFVVGMLRSA